MKRSEIARWSLIAIAVLMILPGLQAAFAPRSFFDDFPLGRGWISVGHTASDEHLVRDVGGIVPCADRRDVVVSVAPRGDGRGSDRLARAGPAAPRIITQGHLDGLGGADKAGLVGSLVLVPALALVSLWATHVGGPIMSDATAEQGCRPALRLVARHVLDELLLLILAGIPVGVVVAGLGSRLAMLVLRITSDAASSESRATMTSRSASSPCRAPTT